MFAEISYVAHAAVLTLTTATPDQLRHFTGWALSWNTWASASFLRAYLAQSASTPIGIRPTATPGAAEVTGDGDGRDALLQFFMLDSVDARARR